MKTKSKTSGYIVRSAAYAALLSCLIVGFSSAFNLPGKWSGLSRVILPGSMTKPATQTKTLTFADRVAYQRAIEEVYWQHRNWPTENDGAKPPLDKVMSQAEIEKKVEDYLRNSQALEDYWQRPITPDQLQAEMERMASHTKQPEVLREIFGALGNDPFVIVECLARPVLAERLITELYAHDRRFHGELKRRAEAELRTHPRVRQMKQTSGMYTEMEWIKSDSAETDSALGETKNLGAVKMNRSEWNKGVGKLAEQFGGSRQREAAAFGVRPHVAAFESADMSAHSKNTAAEYETLPVGKLSPLQEDEGHYYALAVMNKGKDRLKLATVAWLKEPLRSWLAKAETQVPVTMAAVSANYTLPTISSDSPDSCTDDTWTATQSSPFGRTLHTAVWTGSEMIVWGGIFWYDSGGFALSLNTGGRYNPSTDSWTATSATNAPTARYGHTAVWTGTQMIVWGGAGDVSGLTNTGARYNPGTNSWTATSTINAPTARYYHRAVWTGTQMIIWGGYNLENTGGRYNPGTDSWTAASTTNAPTGRIDCTAVWTGSEMIIWGGYDGSSYFNSGGRYNPSTDSWTATSTTNAPYPRLAHTAVWTGTQLIVWGGTSDAGPLNTGGRYDPSTDSWTATSATNAPTARYYHTAVWTGTQMVVWGGVDGSPPSGLTNTGGKYNPVTNSWTATSTTNAPVARLEHRAVWTGSEMIVWGGRGAIIGNDIGLSYLNTGGRYNPTTDSWIATTTTLTARSYHTAVWTGSEMVVWGGSGDVGGLTNTGGRYNPGTNSWTATSTTNAPTARYVHTAVWTGSEMIVWGGRIDSFGNYSNTGGRYNPSTDSWTATSTTNAPTARGYHTAVWTGTRMIVWGGFDPSGVLNTGGRYNPSTDSWTATGTTNAPTARGYHTAVWTGSEMVVWGGSDSSGASNTGGRYNPSTNSWTAASTTNAPTGRYYHTAVWTSSEMIVWGGIDSFLNYLNTGGRYNPSTDSWTATSTTNAPTARGYHTAVWTGSEMIVWGGFDPSGVLNTGGRYTPGTDSWTGTSTTNAPTARDFHTAVWTGSEMIVWGGLYYDDSSGFFLTSNTGGRYCAQPPPPPTVRVTIQTNPAGRTFSVDGTTYSSTQRFTWASGSSHTIATTSPQSGGTGVRYTWTKWSDHGAISHTVAPTTNTTYTATFRTQYFLTMTAGTGGTVSPRSGWKNSGATVSISATPATDYSFSTWTGTGTGSYSGTNNPASITMGGPITEMATFIHN